jgi:B-cell receptor-associated protein 31
MYLTGFTIFLSLILNRTYSLILEQLRLEEEVKRLTGDPTAAGKATKGLNQAGDLGEISKLKKDLAKAHTEIETLKSQSEGFQREYNRLSDEKIGPNVAPKKDK